MFQLNAFPTLHYGHQNSVNRTKVLNVVWHNAGAVTYRISLVAFIFASKKDRIRITKMGKDLQVQQYLITLLLYGDKFY